MASVAASQYTLSQINASILPSIKQQWNRTPYSTILAVSGAAIAGAGAAYLGYRWYTAERLQTKGNIAETIAEPERCGLDPELVDQVKRTAERLIIAPREGLAVNISRHRFVVVKEQNNVPDIYMLDKRRSLGEGAYGIVNHLFSLNTDSWEGGKAMKMFREANSPALDNGIKIVGLINPDGKTRGCISPPYPVRACNTDQDIETDLWSILMRVYDSDLEQASLSDGIIEKLRLNPTSAPYFVDIAHQALSILVILKKNGISHQDIKPKNIFISRGKDGFIDFHLGDWDVATIRGSSKLEIRQMGLILYMLITGEQTWDKQPFDNYFDLPRELGEIILTMYFQEAMYFRPRGKEIENLLQELNEQIVARASDPGATDVWKNVAQRAGVDLKRHAQTSSFRAELA